MKDKWLCLVNTILLHLCSVDMCCAVTGLYMAFIGGVLRIFDEIDFYIFSHSFIERVYCG